MGLNFRKSIKLGDNTKLNLSKKSASVTVGSKGVHRTVSTTGRQTTTVGIPGTGLSYTKTSRSSSLKKSSKKNKTAQLVISVICSIVALVFVIIGVVKYLGIGGSSLSWRKDEYDVAVGKSVNMILEVKSAGDLTKAKASDFTIEIDNEDAVTVKFKQAYSETVHFTVTGIEEGAASVKITYDGKTSKDVTVNVSE